MRYSEEQVYQVLAEKFGFSEFLSAQKLIVTELLEGNSLLAVMPTGSGKSLCFQLPALLLDGYTLVVSPMISLMKDQVMQMRQLGIPAAMHNSLQSPDEQASVRRDLAAGKIKLLYMAPETIIKQSIMQLLESRPPSLIAVDEAHCISMWGHDFRPEYRMLSELRQRFPKVACFALTATAIPKVRLDICEQLSIPPEKQVIESFNRPNLLLAVEPKRESFNRLISFLNAHQGESGIVYCMTRATVDRIADKLCMAGFQALPYHAGLADEERHHNQEAFINDEVRIMVATIAFGMGINKSNIRFVIHLDLPKSLENYYQEIGRAGRDGLPSTCLLLYSKGDLIMLKKIVYGEDKQQNKNIKRHLEAMVKYCESDLCRRKPLLEWFGEKHHQSNCQMCDNCLEETGEKTDVSLQARKFLSAVYRAREQYPVDRIIKILRGSKAKELVSAGDTELSVWGIGKDWPPEQWFAISQALRKAEVLSLEYPNFRLALTPISWQILNGERVFEMPSSLLETMLQATQDDQDEQLFEQLSALRKDIARQQQVPPYIIFSDTSLREMATAFPQPPQSFLKVSGVGSYKLEKYGEAFLNTIRSYCQVHGIEDQARQSYLSPSRKEKSSRSMEVAAYCKEGHNLQECMVRFGLQLSTILEHLQRYMEADGCLDPDQLKGYSFLDEAELAKARAAFEAHGLEALGPAYYALGESISYTDLRLVRLIMLAEYASKELG